MNDTLCQRIMERLRRGQDLPREWVRDILPPEKWNAIRDRREASKSRAKA
jgi:hypothetical protein